MMRLKNIALLPHRISNKSDYPFNIPAIASLNILEITSRLCFFVGENGTAKSTLLEAIALHYGFGAEGGTRNFSSQTTDSVDAIKPRSNALPSPSQNEPGLVSICGPRVFSISPPAWMS
jgi:predicted ATPase